MISPITAGISQEFDPYLDSADAKSFLKSRGIALGDREVDNKKKDPARPSPSTSSRATRSSPRSPSEAP